MMAHMRALKFLSAALVFAAGVLGVYTAHAQPNFSAPVFYATDAEGETPRPTSVAAADLDGDGDPDLVVANTGRNRVAVLQNEEGIFTLLPLTLVAGGTPVFVIAADLNADDRPDIAVANSEGTVFIWRNTSTGEAINFDNAVPFNVGPGPAVVTAADLCGPEDDGLLDLVIANVNLPDSTGDGVSGNDERVSILCNTSNNGLIAFDVPAIPFITREDATFQCCTSPVFVAVGHLIPGSLRNDVVVAHLNVPPDRGSNGFSVLRRNNDSTIGLDPPPPEDGGDILGFDFEENRANLIFNFNGDPAHPYYPSTVLVANLDNIPPEDLVFTEGPRGTVLREPGNDNTITVVLNTTVDDFAEFQQHQPPITVGMAPRALAAADIDNNGSPALDIVVVNRDSNTLSVLLNNGEGTLNSALTIPVGTSPRAVAVVDVDNDGDRDLVVANRGSNNVAVLFNLLVNAPPVALEQTVSTDEDTDVAITLEGSDPEEAALTVAVVANPSNGTFINLALPEVTYRPNPDFNGTDSFTFRVNDGQLDSIAATVTINVTPVNDPPVAASQDVTTAEDTVVNITLNGSDVDGDGLTFVIIDPGPTNGALGTVTPINATSASVGYTPHENFFGSDAFTFAVNDGQAASDPVTVTLTVTPVNDPPVAQDNTIATLVNTPLTSNIVADDEDVDGDTLTIVAVTQPANGRVEHDDSTITYTPDGDFVGEDSFTYAISDGAGGMDDATVFVTVTQDNVPPVADAQRVSTAQDLTVEILLTGSDIEGNDLSFRVVTGPTNGTLVVDDLPVVTYAANSGFTGNDSFTFVVNDGEVDSTEATVTIMVTSCPADGDVNRDGQRTPADVVQIIDHYLGRELSFDACQQVRANVLAPENSGATPGDAQCVMQAFLRQESCLN